MIGLWRDGQRSRRGLAVSASGYSTPRPQAQPSRKGFVHRLLGQIKIAEQADQGREDSPRIDAIKGVEQFADLLGGELGHDDDVSKPATLNQFSKRAGHQTAGYQTAKAMQSARAVILKSPETQIPTKGGRPAVTIQELFFHEILDEQN